MVSPSAQRRALESAYAIATPLFRRLRLLSKRGVSQKRCHKTAMNVIKAGNSAIALAQSSDGVPRECSVEAHRRQGAISWAATAPPACAPLVGALIGRLRTRRLHTLERASLNRDTVQNHSWKVRQAGGSLVPGDYDEKGTSPGRWRQSKLVFERLGILAGPQPS
jgi:hypothetical protein